MTATVAERLDAGIDKSGFREPRTPARFVDVPDFVSDRWGNTRSAQTETAQETLQTELKRLQQGPAALERARKLRVLLAKLEGLAFEEAAELLDQKPLRLAEMLHGRSAVPSSLQRRIDELGEIVVNLHEVLAPRAFKRWLYIDAPELRGGSPMEAIKRGRIRDVVVLAASYGDSSFA